MHAEADDIRDCPSCRLYFSRAFAIPHVWWQRYYRRSNGYFGYESNTDSKGSCDSLVTWVRFLVKRLETPKRYAWYKLNIFTRWIPVLQRSIVLVFDAPALLKSGLPTSLFEVMPKDDIKDPFWVHVQLLAELARSQDSAVWDIRTHTREAEKQRSDQGTVKSDFSTLHELARHAIHVSETLDVAVDIAQAITTQHKAFIQDGSGTIVQDDMASASRNVHERLLSFTQIIQSLRSRASSNEKRIQNEIQLAFNTVAQRNAANSLELSRAAWSDSAAMKTIAFLTLAFLPPTYISAVFSMSFFDYDAGTGKWTVSEQIWIYWVVALPVTLAICYSWYLWNRNFHGFSLIGPKP